MGKSGKLHKIEPFLLFSVIFLPGYLTQMIMEADPGMFNDGLMLFFYFITAVPQIFLILYMIYGDTRIPPTVYGIGPVRTRSILLSFPGLAGIFLALIPVYILNAVFMIIMDFQEFDGVQWQFTNLSLLPAVLISCMVTGYLEEMFFRSYLTTRMTFQGYSRIRIVVVVNILFALGHLYQGIPGLAGTFVIGIYLTLLFFIQRDIHLIAITHGLYNFTILIISSFIPESM